MASGGSALVLVALLAACGDDAADRPDAEPVDAADRTDAGGAVVEPPDEPAFPRLAVCPPGWRAVPPAGDMDFATCDPAMITTRVILTSRAERHRIGSRMNGVREDRNRPGSEDDVAERTRYSSAHSSTVSRGSGLNPRPKAAENDSRAASVGTATALRIPDQVPLRGRR